MEAKKKFASINLNKLDSGQREALMRIKTISNNFKTEDKQVMTKIDAALDNIIEKLKKSNPDAIKGAVSPKKPSVTQTKSSTTKKTPTAKTSTSTSAKRNTMTVAKEIRKQGESWSDAMKRAKEIFENEKQQTNAVIKTQTDKLLEFIKKRKELEGLSGTSVRKDVKIQAKPKGRRVSQKGWKNQYGESDGGRVYYENRDNRSDRLAPSFKDKIYLEKGGAISDAPFSVEVFKTRLRFDNELPSSSKGDFSTFAKAKEFAIDMIDNGNYYAYIISKSGYLWGVDSKGVEQFAGGGNLSSGRFKFNIGDKVMIDDSGYVKSFTEFDLSKPAEIIDRSKTKMGGKTYYFYKVRMADGRTAFNQALEKNLKLVEKEEQVDDLYLYGGEFFANGGSVSSDVSKYKKQLIAKAKSKGLYENFGQAEVRKLEDKYGYTREVREFDNWAMNFDLSQAGNYANGGNIDEEYDDVFMKIYNKYNDKNYFGLKEQISNALRNWQNALDKGDKHAEKYTKEDVIRIVKENNISNSYNGTYLRLKRAIRISDVKFLKSHIRYDQKFTKELYEELTGNKLPNTNKEIQNYFDSKYANGGDVGIPKSKSLRNFVLNEASSGMIANKIPYSDYKTIDSVRLTAIQILNRDGDREYSVQSFNDLIQEALLEYEENKYESRFANGGKLSSTTTYIPNRDVKELHVVLKGELLKLSGGDVVDGVYAKNNSLKTTKTKKARTTTSKTKAIASAISIFKKLEKIAADTDSDLGLDIDDVQSLLDVGFNENDILVIYEGYTPKVTNADTEFGNTTSGLNNSSKEYQKSVVKTIVENANNDMYEIGFKYPDFDWKGIVKKFSIDLNPKTKIVKRDEYQNKIEYYLGKGIIIGHGLGFKWDSDKTFNKSIDEFGKIDLTKPNEYQKERDLKAGFNGGYWGIVVRKKEDVYYILDTLLKQKNGYAKDIEVFANGLGGINALEAKGESFESGGSLIGIAETPLAHAPLPDYTGLVGETGAMASGEMFKKGGKVNQSNRQMYVKEISNRTGTRESALDKFFNEANLQDSEVLSILTGLGRGLLKPIEVVGATVGDEVAKVKVIDFSKSGSAFQSSKKAFELGGDTGLPMGAEQHFSNYYLGEGASAGIFEQGGSLVDGYLTDPNFGNFQSAIYADGGAITDVVDAIFFPNQKSGKIKTSFGDKTKEGLFAMITNVNYDAKEVSDAIFEFNEKSGKINTGFGSKTKEGLTEMIKNVRNTFANGGAVKGSNLKIKDWYTKTYPTDDLGEELDENKTFADMWTAIHNGTNVYEVLGVGDSVVRERVFEELSVINGVDYKYVYKKWLDSDNYANGGFVSKGEHVWKKLSTSKRLDFLQQNFTPEITPRTQETLSGKDFRFLPRKVKIVIESKYADVEDYANGGIYSSDDVYSVLVYSLNGDLLTTTHIRAKNQKEANEFVEDKEDFFKKKYGSDLRFKVSKAYAMGGSLSAHGLQEGDKIVKTISGGILKVQTKDGGTVYVDLKDGYRENQPPLPFAKGGRLKSALMRDRKYKNYSEDHEVRYSKSKPNRRGYGFEDGGQMPTCKIEKHKND